MRGRLRWYAVYQFYDFMLTRGFALILVGVLLSYPAVEQLRKMDAMGMPRAEITQQALYAALSMVGVIFVLMTLNGFISSERTVGHYRFLFAKPVSIVEYYAQVFVVNGIALLACCAVLMALLAVTAYPVSPWGVLGYIGFTYLAMGGIGFFVSAISRFDWVLLGGIWVVSRVFRSMYVQSDDWRGVVAQLLPPVDQMARVADAMVGIGTLAMADVLSALGYSAIFFGAGVLALRRRSFAA